MSGMEPILIGSAIGAATNRKNPIQGAMLGGFLGGAGSAIAPSLSSLGGAASSGVNPGILSNAASGSMTAATNPALVTSSLPASATGVGFQTAAQIPTNIANEAAKQGLFAGAPRVTPFVSGPSSVEASMFADKPTIFQQLGSYAQENPVLTQMGMQSAQSLLNQQSQQPAPAGIMRGSPSQVQMPQYQVGVPKVSLI